MGIDLVKMALVVVAGDVSGNAFKVLTYMAATALDVPNGKGQPARLYFAGWQPLARVLGQDPTKGKKAYEQVRRALKELEEKGHISRLNVARQGVRQTFRLELSLSSEPPEIGGAADHQNGGAQHLRNGGTVTPQNGGLSPSETGPPRTDSGPSRTHSRTSKITALPQPQTARKLPPLPGKTPWGW